jgi:hypothetical protein
MLLTLEKFYRWLQIFNIDFVIACFYALDSEWNGILKINEILMGSEPSRSWRLEENRIKMLFYQADSIIQDTFHSNDWILSLTIFQAPNTMDNNDNTSGELAFWQLQRNVFKCDLNQDTSN